MARSTWGSIREKSKGAFELRYRVDGEYKSKTVRGTRKAAEKELALLRVKYEGSTRSQMTINDFWDRVMVPECEMRITNADSAQGMSPTTLRGYKSTYDAAIRTQLGNTRMDKLKAADVQSWLNTMTKGAATHAKAILKLTMRRAEDLEYIEHHPMNKRYIMPGAKGSGGRTKDIYTPAELEAIFRDCAGEVWEAAFILSAFGGGTKNEVFGAKLQEISFEQDERGFFAIVPIKRGVHFINKKVEIIERTKNEYRAAPLVIPEPYSVRLHELAQEGITAGNTWLTDDGFGEPCNPERVVARYKAWLSRSSYRFIPFSNLRNAYSTMMHAQGLEDSTVSKLMRHSNLATDYRHYNRPDVEIFKDALSHKAVC
jgi:integrase